MSNLAQNSAEQRDMAASKDKGTMPNGSFPIMSQHQANSAWKLRGKSKDYSEAEVVAHIKARCKALGLKFPGDMMTSNASLECPVCDRTFLSASLLTDHAEAVHSYNTLRDILQQACKDTFGGQPDMADPETQDNMGGMGGDGMSMPMGGGMDHIYCYVEDFTDTWVVFSCSCSHGCDMYQCSYTISNNEATLGDPTEVMRVTSYVPVGDPQSQNSTAKLSFLDSAGACKPKKK